MVRLRHLCTVLQIYWYQHTKKLAHASPVWPSWAPLYSIPLLSSAAVYPQPWSHTPGHSRCKSPPIYCMPCLHLASVVFSPSQVSSHVYWDVAQCSRPQSLPLSPEAAPQANFCQLKELLTSIANWVTCKWDVINPAKISYCKEYSEQQLMVMIFPDHEFPSLVTAVIIMGNM